ncbi:iron-containing alcohol dehydrogenase [Paludibacter propionicigenes WB4]|uniref:Iron-containing alcohol dehydrogenase n=1 Tax=Paludibacter propionicigenes (strain DSM 17365 / JCM 13257 / WB4) TaxID=694427 RepID=E4T877_PALPW|nr:iron-containing alcohol dehydrogenase [Paludibacter propionicigenes]ADQ80921.1 iron-containing alcohol dehydrogenase [Paludibacter propionicigenes WB4]
MNNFNFYSPTHFVFGKNRESETGKYVKRFGGSKVLIHFGGGSVIKSGLLDRVKESLTKENISFTELGGVVPNPRSGLVYEGVEICKREKIDFILAVGGGSAIDSAKAIAIGALYDGDFWDFYTGKRVENALPVATILTISAAGSEGSTGSVITHEDGMLKRAANSDALRPVFSVLNPELTCSLPPFQTACGATDMMAHVLERYFTNTKDVEITDRLCEAVLLTVIKETPKALANPNDYEARANIMWAGTVAHNDICGVGREQDWSTHQIEHELSGLYDVAHGAGLAVMFPAWMKYVMKHDVMRFAQFAVRVWGCQMDFQNPENTAKEGILKFEQFLTSIGMPIRFSELGAKAEDIPTLAKTMGLGTGTLGSFVKLTTEDVTKIYELAV